MEDNIEANASTFSSEMRESAFILRNVEPGSLVIVDELGRGTSTRDGLAIAIAIAEALYATGALVWFVTHFRDVARFLGERPGFQNYHLTVKQEPDRMLMLYKVGKGCVEEEHYGLAMAKVMGLPREIVDVAAAVSRKIVSNGERRRRGSPAIIQARKRKLVLYVKEQLEHARDGTMRGEVLKRWLEALQDKVVLELVRVEKAETMAQDDCEGSRDTEQETQDGVSRENCQDDCQQESMDQSNEPEDTNSAIARASTPLGFADAEDPPEKSSPWISMVKRSRSTGSTITMSSSAESREFKRLRGRSMSTDIPDDERSQPGHRMTGALGDGDQPHR